MKKFEDFVVANQGGQARVTEADPVETIDFVDGRRPRKVPVLSEGRAELFAGIEKSQRFTAEATYAAFANIRKKKQGSS